LVILATFDYGINPWPLQSSDQPDWNNKFFGIGTTPPSLHDYYSEVSYGQLDIMPALMETSLPSGNGVVGWYDLARIIHDF
jgi:hypothetical protein